MTATRVSLRRVLRVGVVLSLVSTGLAVHAWTGKLAAFSSSLYPVSPTIAYGDLEVRRKHFISQPDGLLWDATAPFAFRDGETLSQVLDGLGVEPPEAQLVVEQLSKFVDPRRLKPSDHYAARLEGTRLEAFEVELARRGRARVWRVGQDWVASWREFEMTRSVHRAAGLLEGSLENSLEGAGGEAALAILLADVFQWDLDFTRDLRLGDAFQVLYEKTYLDGSYDSLGDIVAVAYENDGRTLEAYRFGDDSVFYDAEGRPLRKMFLRSPLRYSRISSGFSRKRFHPILKRYRPHYGVDYGAPTGTPVRVTANGSVTFSGWDGGGGKTIKVRHPNGYLTAYLHLSRFATGIRSGKKVSQGDIIGYVGSTGLSTAPHLDYRVQSQGKWLDPLSLKSVPAEPVPQGQLPAFMAWRDRIRQALFDGAPLDDDSLSTESLIAAVATDFGDGVSSAR